MPPDTSFLVGLLASAYLLAAVGVLGARRIGYSHVRDTISELGEAGSPQAKLVAAGVFLPVGLAMLALAWLSPQPASGNGSSGSVLASCLGIGYIVAALFPCDPGSPLSGSWRQAVHNAGGAVEYLGGAFALTRIAGAHGQPFDTLATVVLGAAVAMSVPALARVRGLVQRVAESSLFGALVWVLWQGG